MNTTARKLLRLLVLIAVVASAGPTQAGLFGPKGDNPSEKRAAVRKDSEAMLAELYRTRPEMKKRLRKAAGYATFSQKDVNLFLLASGNGYGVLVENGFFKKEVFMRMASLGGGLGLGVKDVRVIFVFNDADVMRRFVEEGWQFGGKADASAKYKDTGVSAEQNVKANVDFTDGTGAAGSSTDLRASDGDTSGKANFGLGGALEIYQFTEHGISLQATVSGTKYWKDSKLNK